MTEQEAYSQLLEQLEEWLLVRWHMTTTEKNTNPKEGSNVVEFTTAIAVQRTVLTLLMMAREKAGNNAEFAWRAVREAILGDAQAAWLESFTADDEKALEKHAKAEELRSIFRVMVDFLQAKKREVPESGTSQASEDSHLHEDNHEKDG